MLKEGTFIKKKFTKLYIAAFLGWLVALLGGMADSIIAGLFLDSEAVSAVGLITPISSLIYFLAYLISIGTALYYAKTLGAFQYEKAKKIAGMGIFVAIVVGILLVIFLLIFREQILGFYGVEGQIYQYAEEYFWPTIISSGLCTLIWTIYYLVSYDGDEVNILIVDIFMAVANSAFSLLFVQTMGIEGLAYGTLLSEIGGGLLLIPHFFKKSNSIRFKFHFSWKELFYICKLASATALVTLYIGVIDVIFNKLVIELFTEDYLPAYAVINVAMNFANALICSINAGVVFISVAYGENNPFAQKRIMKLTNTFVFFSSIALTIVMEFLAPVWPTLYAIEDPGVYDAAVYAGRIVPIFFLAAGYIYTYLEYYQATEKPLEGNILSLSYMLFGPIVISIPLAFLFGFDAMSFGFAITPVFSILVLVLYFVFTKKIKKAPNLIQDTDEQEIHFDFKIDVDSIVEVRNKIGQYLTEQKVDSSLVNKVEVIFEDAMTFIMKRNKKKIICECSVLINDKHIRLITKDNGVIFDLVEEADNSVDLQGYLLARMMADAKESTNSVTTSFNRNTCIWER